MKKIITLLASLALVASGLSIVPASAAGGGELKLFLRSTGCSAADVNFDYLSIVDEDDAIECNYTGAGIRNEIGNSAATPVTANRETATRYWDSVDGGPVALDATRPVTGSIFTAGAACATTATPCSPVTFSAGEVILDITLVGISGGNEVELGAQTETFNAAPGAPRETVVNIQPDAAANGKVFETIELRTWVHGKSGGHGVIKTTGEFSSFISVPTSTAGSSGKTPPGKNPIPGKKKGCDKGKGKKRGCEGKGKKSPQPGKPSAECASFTPGEAGKDKPAVVLTDEATAEKPVEQTVTLGQSTADVTPTDPTYDYFNVVVDSKAANAGLYATFEFPTRRDYDLDLLHTDGSYAARSHGFNVIGELYSTPLYEGREGHGGKTTASSESLVGIKTDDCGGWTMQTTNWLGEGGELTVKLWLGDAQIDPQEAGAETP